MIAAAVDRMTPSLGIIGGQLVKWKEEQEALSGLLVGCFCAPLGGARCKLLDQLVAGARKLVMGDAQPDDSQVVLLEGDPGSGKSALMSQLATELASSQMYTSTPDGRREAQEPVENGSECLCVNLTRQSKQTYSQVLQCLTQQAYLRAPGIAPPPATGGWSDFVAALLVARKTSGRRIVVIVDGLAFNEAVHFIAEAANECSFRSRASHSLLNRKPLTSSFRSRVSDSLIL